MACLDATVLAATNGLEVGEKFVTIEDSASDLCMVAIWATSTTTFVFAVLREELSILSWERLARLQRVGLIIAFLPEFLESLLKSRAFKRSMGDNGSVGVSGAIDVSDIVGVDGIFVGADFANSAVAIIELEIDNLSFRSIFAGDTLLCGLPKMLMHGGEDERLAASYLPSSVLAAGMLDLTGSTHPPETVVVMGEDGLATDAGLIGTAVGT
jgi:hypothetical protein